MPVYEYFCNKCGIEFDKHMSVENRNTVEHCGELAVKKIGNIKGVLLDQKIKDLRGTPIYFPKDGASYYDKALGVEFHSKKQKAEYMKEKGYFMDASEDSSKQKQASRHLDKEQPVKKNPYELGV